MSFVIHQGLHMALVIGCWFGALLGLYGIVYSHLDDRERHLLGYGFYKIAFGFVILAGLTTVWLCGYWVVADWDALIRAYWDYKKQIGTHHSFERLVLAESFQNMHRINCLADGLGFLGGAVITVLGALGWLLTSRR